ncbi:MAG: hypothetical protein V1820_05070 [archaeon]
MTLQRILPDDVQALEQIRKGENLLKSWLDRHTRDSGTDYSPRERPGLFGKRNEAATLEELERAISPAKSFIDSTMGLAGERIGFSVLPITEENLKKYSPEKYAALLENGRACLALAGASAAGAIAAAVFPEQAERILGFSGGMGIFCYLTRTFGNWQAYRKEPVYATEIDREKGSIRTISCHRKGDVELYWLPLRAAEFYAYPLLPEIQAVPGGEESCEIVLGAQMNLLVSGYARSRGRSELSEELQWDKTIAVSDALGKGDLGNKDTRHLIYLALLEESSRREGRSLIAAQREYILPEYRASCPLPE